VKKADFLTLMKFPKEWATYEMYPDELFNGQVSQYQPGDENAGEHDRNGAFHWWLRRSPTREQLDKLLRLAALDPDRMMGDDVRNHIRKASAFDDQLAFLEKELFRSR
jgi:hypothetical protein